MKTTWLFGVVPLALALSATAALANTVTLDCKLNLTQRAGGWIPSAALMEVNRQTKGIKLIRPTPDQMNGRVVSSKLVRESADRMVLRWEVTVAPSRLTHRACLDREGRLASRLGLSVALMP